jgi:hypothetical protein
MNRRKQPTALSNAGSYLGMILTGIAAGTMMAFTLHMLSHGGTLIPNWVISACGALGAVAMAIALREKDARGIACGAAIMLAVLFLLGFSEITGESGASVQGHFNLDRSLADLLQMIAIMFPLFACMVAIALPLALPRDHPHQ